MKQSTRKRKTKTTVSSSKKRRKQNRQIEPVDSDFFVLECRDFFKQNPSIADFDSCSLSAFPEIVKSLVLLTSWLQQRNLDSSQRIGGFSSELLIAWLTYLLNDKLLTERMKYRKVLETVWKAFKEICWHDSDVSLYCGSEIHTDFGEFRTKFEMVFVDSTGNRNLASKLSRFVYDRLRNEATKALSMLASDKSDSFGLLFLTKIPFERSFDHFLRLTMTLESDTFCPTDGLLSDADSLDDQVTTIATVLRRGLGDRVALIDVQYEKSGLLFGLLIDKFCWSGLLTRGPSANDSTAKEFRRFWGQKSELRKFVDNDICEAVVWDDRKSPVPEQIARYLLKSHFSIGDDRIQYKATQLEMLPDIDTIRMPCFCEDQRSFGLISKALDRITQSLRLLQNLPLGIASIQPMSPILRQTEPFPPMTNVPYSKSMLSAKAFVRSPKCSLNSPSPPFVQSLEVFCTLESSGKWPEDLAVIRRLKTAFYLKMGQLLKDQFDTDCFPRSDCLFIKVNGFIFRLVIINAKEVYFLKNDKHTGGTVLKDTIESKELEMSMVHGPKLASLLASLSQNHPSFGTACRLVKRWTCANFLSDLIPDLVLELLLAHLFVHSEPYDSPSSPLCAFGRFLHLISHHDWLRLPVIVDFLHDWDAEKVDIIHRQFVRFRPTLPPMCISSPDDELGCRWTRTISPMLMSRFSTLSTLSLNQLDGFIRKDVDIRSIFLPSLAHYDVLIHLHRRHVTRKLSSSKKGEKRGQHLLEIVDFDPVFIFVAKLRSLFDHLAVFFYDKYGGDTVAVLWKPTARQSCEPKISKVSGRHLTNENPPTIQMNIPAILEDFSVIGHGLVRRIEIIRSF